VRGRWEIGKVIRVSYLVGSEIRNAFGRKIFARSAITQGVIRRWVSKDRHHWDPPAEPPHVTMSGWFASCIRLKGKWERERNDDEPS
jgi:hypothetical protein